MAFFSVVIPVYNKEKFIEETINSVLCQNFNDFEVVIIDDGSTDTSLQIVSQIQDSRISIITQKNKGVSEARNVGIKHASSKYIALLDADDIWKKNHLTELKKLIFLFPDAGLYCNNYEIYYSKKVIKKPKFNLNYNNNCLIVKDYFKASIKNSVAWTSAVCFPKEKFNAIGKFNSKYKTGQDLDLWIRFALKHKISFNPTITMGYKYYISNSLSKNEYNTIRYNFLTSYLKEEQLYPSLKLYLDQKRYGLALRSKINNETNIYLKTMPYINPNNLTFKQRILLKLPKYVLTRLNKLRDFAIRSNFYLRFFKR